MALAQAHETRARLSQAFDLEESCFEIIVIKTTGDRVLVRRFRRFTGDTRVGLPPGLPFLIFSLTFRRFSDLDISPVVLGVLELTRLLGRQ